MTNEELDATAIIILVLVLVAVAIVYGFIIPSPEQCMSINRSWSWWGCIQ